jgi:succinyl-diaminopimelate desuccinylase
MKGGLAVIADLLDDPRIGAGWCRVGVILYAGEEGPLEENDLGRLLEGAAKWAASAALAILLEPTDAQIEVGCVGLVNVEVIFRGEACHSARPWLGRSAVEIALPWLESIAAFQPREHEIAGFTFRETATITTLQAGTARNIVPGELIANLNYRFPPGWDRDRGRRMACNLAEGAGEVRVVDEAPSAEVPLERPQFAAFVHGSGLPCRAKQAWTDVAQFSELGVPALNFGPGDPQLAHRDDERVRIEALDRCRATIEAFLVGDAPFSQGRTGRTKAEQTGRRGEGP